MNKRMKKLSHLKVGMFSSFGGTGPENKLFSTFLIRVRKLISNKENHLISGVTSSPLEQHMG